MKVIVVGGYGVFGSRLVQLLVRDGHRVIVAGRSGAKGQAFVTKHAIGANADILQLDRADDLAPLWALHPDVVVDAAGPFHGYGENPYRLAQGCIDHAVHYLDLADDPAFCAGITCLDPAAKRAGVFVLSGASSVPAVSSAVVAALAGKNTEIDLISTAIMPGNRAPRGRAVVESILHQCGRPIDMIVDRTPVSVRSWSLPQRFALGAGINRRAWLMEVPDTRLFADFFQARTVMFRAGMELRVMNVALAVISAGRGRVAFGITPWFVAALMWIADRLKPFGTDVGGMSVTIICGKSGMWTRKTWCLVASAGEGPYIPAIASRVILRDTSGIRAGARPALAEISLDAIEEGLKDLSVKTTRNEDQIVPLFIRFLGGDFEALPNLVQAAHDVPAPRHMKGRARVIRGASLWARLIAGLFRFPQATDDIPVTVVMTPSGNGETWERKFGEQVFRSHLKVADGKMTERFGPFTFTLGLHVADGALHFPVASGRLGPLPLPRFLLPVSIAKEHVAEGRFRFDVKLMAPLTGGLMVHYQGWLMGSDAA